LVSGDVNQCWKISIPALKYSWVVLGNGQDFSDKAIKIPEEVQTLAYILNDS
jgi:hypothetical protein